MANQTAPGATASLIFGILSLLVCQLLGIVAILQANSAMRAIEADPSLEGADQAKIGKILGIIGLVLMVVAVIPFFVFFVLLAGSAATQGG